MNKLNKYKSAHLKFQLDELEEKASDAKIKRMIRVSLGRDLKSLRSKSKTQLVAVIRAVDQFNEAVDYLSKAVFNLKGTLDLEERREKALKIEKEENEERDAKRNQPKR